MNNWGNLTYRHYISSSIIEPRLLTYNRKHIVAYEKHDKSALNDETGEFITLHLSNSISYECNAQTNSNEVYLLSMLSSY